MGEFMPRPRRCRSVRFFPSFTQFTPRGVKVQEFIILTVDELEAVRLKDLKDLGQEEAAKKMGISQPTFNRILKSARKKIADSLVSGKSIRIEGGEYKMVLPRGAGRGRGRAGGFGAGPSGECVCPNCGYRAPHQRGVPCYAQKCPKCGAMMTRG